MTINSISDLSSLISQFSTTNAADRSSDPGAMDASQGISGSAPPPPPGGGLMSAVMEALSSVGTSVDASASSGCSATASAGSSSNVSTTSDSDTQQALQQFMQSLFAALHAQSAGGSVQSDTPSTDSATGATSITAGGGRPNPADDLQSLIRELSASASQSTSSATDSSSNAATTSDATLTNLEQSFQALVSATGGQDGSVTALNEFLSAFARNMSDAVSTGNFVNTHA